MAVSRFKGWCASGVVALLMGVPTLTQALTYGTWNIRNFDYDERYRIRTDKPTLETVLADLKFDLLGVNEIRETAEFARLIQAKFPFYQVKLSNCGGAHGQRLGFVYNSQKLKLLSFNEEFSFSNPGGQPACDGGSRPAAVGLFEDVKSKEKFYAIQVHFKSGSAPDSLGKREKQYDLLKKLVLELQAKGVQNIIASGDFNTTGYNQRAQVDYTKFNSIMKASGLANVSENIQCSAYWWGGTDDGIESPSQLDHILFSETLKAKGFKPAQVLGHCQKVKCAVAAEKDLGEIYTGVSDHCPQLAKFFEK
jgi:endonuclease/exonuclease/phosphatase family metal-dependent hydrolase